MCMKCELGLTDSQFRAMIREKIDEHGWMIQGLDDGSLFYTIGLTEHGLPELVITHVHLRDAVQVLNTLARRQRQAGAFEHGQITDLDGIRVRLDKLWSTKQLVMLNDHYRAHRPKPTALAVVLLDRDAGV